MRRILISVLALLVAACATLPEPARYDLAITNTTVIDPQSRISSPKQTILISGGRIAAIAPAGGERFYAQDEVDGSGKFVIPGLMNMHAHSAVAPVAEATFALMLANGVTGIRDMSADCWEPRGEIFLCIDQMREYARKIEAGELDGPRLLRLSSPIVQSAPTWQLPESPDPAFSPATAEQGAQIARMLKQRGVDLIKTYDRFHPDSYLAMLAAASALDLEVSGHLPIFIGSAEASRLGHRSIEHARDLLTDCSRFGEVYREGNMATLRGEDGASWPKQDDLRVLSVTQFDPEICAQVMGVLVANSTYYVPTHGTREMDVRAREDTYRNDPRLKYMHPFVVGDWKKDLDRTAQIPADQLPKFQAYYRHGLAITKFASDAGVKLMIGTDANDTMMFPGFGVHDEMKRFAEAGLEPMDILRAATSVPAEYLGRTADLGGIAKGKIADLVVLNSDPLTDIGNTADIDAVVFGGRLRSRDYLDGLLDALAERHSETPASSLSE
ncbi:amidohydrolase family protein [Erythrobacter ani]|uniref:Amidohydrolase family protein n=1 Tax=Erythrobacter ani TaxID=2827235 RepID=A0ABS6SQC4_9SPHN|nr:amidohydrolase family protein [Erythrobacter ani]MBV7267254.1 amidohydrolase family protein [Erythrobacter ani]